jgi:hypothetical protein
MWSFVNQTLAALANLKIGVIQSQLRHSKSGEGAVGFGGLAHPSEGAQVLIESRKRAFESVTIPTIVARTLAKVA